MIPEMGCFSNFFCYINFCGGMMWHRNGDWSRNGKRLSFSE